MAPCTHPGMKRLFGLKAKNGLITSIEVNAARWPYTCIRPCAFEEKKTKKNPEKSAQRKTHHEIHNNPATATTSRRRATKHVPHVSPYSHASIDPGFVCGNRPRTALAISKNDECYAYITLADTQPDRRTDGRLIN